MTTAAEAEAALVAANTADAQIVYLQGRYAETQVEHDRVEDEWWALNAINPRTSQQQGEWQNLYTCLSALNYRLKNIAAQIAYQQYISDTNWAIYRSYGKI